MSQGCSIPVQAAIYKPGGALDQVPAIRKGLFLVLEASLLSELRNVPCCWCSVLPLAIINQGHGWGAGTWRVSDVVAVSRGWPLAKPINSPPRACPAISAELQGVLTLLWPDGQA